jgi:hypothetical protein
MRSRPWRLVILDLALLFGGWIVLSTEVLSLFQILTPKAIALSWVAFGLGVGAYALQTRRRRSQSPTPSLAPFDLEDRVLLGGIGLILLLLGIMATIAPPNTWDSMTYHLPRIMHWLQQGSVAHYPTANLRQLYQPPGAEYAMLHLYALWGSDRALNFVQWWSAIGCLVGVSLIAEHLGATRRGQLYSLVYVATLPMGILQATSTKNDYLCGFWLVCFAYFTLVAMGRDRLTPPLLLRLSVSLGLLFFTKSTGYLFALPFVISLFIRHWQIFRTPKIAFLFLPFVINLGHYGRNFFAFGSVFFTGDDLGTNQLFTPRAFLSNLIKNIALHLPISYTTIAPVHNMIIALHQKIGISADDPRLNWQESAFNATFSTSEVTAGNPLHFYLLMIVLLVLGSRAKSLWIDQKILMFYCGAVGGGFALFCGLLKWQVWHSRLHLPLFIAIAPVVGVVLDRYFKPRLALYLCFVLLASSSFWLLWSETKPVASRSNIFNIPRQEQYFMTLPYAASYQEAAAYLNQTGCDRIGLWMGSDAWEYPLWAMLKEQPRAMPQLRHIFVENESKRLDSAREKSDAPICAIAQIGPLQAPPIPTPWGEFDRVWSPPSDARQLVNSQLHIYTISAEKM